MFGPERASQPRLVRRGLHERTCLNRMRRFVCHDVCHRRCDLVELGWSRAEQAPRLHLGGGPELDMPLKTAILSSSLSHLHLEISDRT